ncbi:MAG: segregation/condensation protein A [Gammaproteobacteria bacterium]|nr:segregation/condensation protein A [Gammaproteobacteria bacterium]
METLAPEIELQEAVAFIKGEAITELPLDLYIPPQALRVFLEAFEGPMDLLLYLIKKQNLDILNIPIAEVTRQYVEYVELMHELNLELAADYLVMAAFLAEVKSRLLLPKPPSQNTEEVDPRAELIRKLQEYERFKKAAEDLDTLPRVERDVFPVNPQPPEMSSTKPQPTVEIKDLLLALAGVLQRVKHTTHHHIQLETLSIRERMTEILNRVQADKFTGFSDFFSLKEGRIGVVVTFIAILELLRQSLIEIIQSQSYAPIHIRAVSR